MYVSVCGGEALLSQPPDCASVFKCWPTLGLVVMVSSPPVTIAALFCLFLLLSRLHLSHLPLPSSFPSFFLVCSCTRSRNRAVMKAAASAPSHLRTCDFLQRKVELCDWPRRSRVLGSTTAASHNFTQAEPNQKSALSRSHARTHARTRVIDGERPKY